VIGANLRRQFNQGPHQSSNRGGKERSILTNVGGGGEKKERREGVPPFRSFKREQVEDS